MRKHTYGHRPPEIGNTALASGWILGIRHLASKSAKNSFWHRHEETSIICCLRGEYTYEFHGLASITLTAGSFLVIPAHVEHRHLKAIDPMGNRLEILLAPNLKRSLHHSVFDTPTCRTLHASLLKRALSPEKCHKSLLNLCRELYELTKPSPSKLSEEQTAFARILCQHILYKMSRPSSFSEKRAIVPFNDIVKWLESHLSEKIGIDRIVAHIGYSRTQVFNLFHENTGLTPADFLSRLRIKNAKQLLETTGHSAVQIANMCGFSTASVFNAAFRRHTGTTPLEWRLRHNSVPPTAHENAENYTISQVNLKQPVFSLE